jgi:hypothetical protein
MLLFSYLLRLVDCVPYITYNLITIQGFALSFMANHNPNKAASF